MNESSGWGAGSPMSSPDSDKRESIKLRLSNRIKSIKEILVMAEDAFSLPTSSEANDSSIAVCTDDSSTGRVDVVDMRKLTAADHDSSVAIDSSQFTAAVLGAGSTTDSNEDAAVAAVSAQTPSKSQDSTRVTPSSARRGSKLAIMYEQKLEEERNWREKELESKRLSSKKEALKEIGKDVV